MMKLTNFKILNTIFTVKIYEQSLFITNTANLVLYEPKEQLTQT